MSSIRNDNGCLIAGYENGSIAAIESDNLTSILWVRQLASNHLILLQTTEIEPDGQGHQMFCCSHFGDLVAPERGVLKFIDLSNGQVTFSSIQERLQEPYAILQNQFNYVKPYEIHLFNLAGFYCLRQTLHWTNIQVPAKTPHKPKH